MTKMEIAPAVAHALDGLPADQAHRVGRVFMGLRSRATPRPGDAPMSRRLNQWLADARGVAVLYRIVGGTITIDKLVIGASISAARTEPPPVREP